MKQELDSLWSLWQPELNSALSWCSGCSGLYHHPSLCLGRRPCSVEGREGRTGHWTLNLSKGCAVEPAQFLWHTPPCLPTEHTYSSYLCCRDVAALLRPGLSWVVCFYKHMKGHGPSPEVLEVVSKSHRYFLIWIHCWSVCPRAWNSLSAKQAQQEFQHFFPYNTQLICFKPDPQWSSPERKVWFGLPPIQHSALDLSTKMGNQY